MASANLITGTALLAALTALAHASDQPAPSRPASAASRSEDSKLAAARRLCAILETRVEAARKEALAAALRARTAKGTDREQASADSGKALQVLRKAQDDLARCRVTLAALDGAAPPARTGTETKAGSETRKPEAKERLEGKVAAGGPRDSIPIGLGGRSASTTGTAAQDGRVPGKDGPVVHPFIHFSERDAVGDLVRYRWSEKIMNAEMGALTRAVHTDSGLFVFHDRNRKPLGVLFPDGKGVEWHMATGNRDGELYQAMGLAAGPTLVWALFGETGARYQLFRIAEDVSLWWIFKLPEDLAGAPLGLVMLPRPGKMDPLVVLPDQLLLPIREPGAEDTEWLRYARNQGPSLPAGARFEPATRNRFFAMDPATGFLAAVDIDPAGTFAVKPMTPASDALPGDFLLVAWGREPRRRLYVSYPAKDLIVGYDPDSLEPVSTCQLAENTALGALGPGPDGSVLFTLPAGLGCLTAEGTAAAIPVRGGGTAPTDLVRGLLGGKMYFLEANRRSLSSVALYRPGGQFGLPAGRSLLAGAVERTEAKRQAPAEAASATAVTEAKPTAEAKPAAEAADVKGAGDQEPGPEPKEGAGPARDSGETKAGAIVVRLTNRQITHERIGHIREQHRFGSPIRGADGLVKGQFLAEPLQRDREFRQRLWRGANSAEAEVTYEDEGGSVIEFVDEQPVGRVWAAGGWQETRRVRVVMSHNWKKREDFLVTAFPVPE